MDYLIADAITLPTGLEDQFVERIWRLPKIYLCFTPPSELVDIPPLPANDSGFVTFGSYNNLSKVSDDIIALWAEILASVPGSKLRLKAAQLAVPSVCRRITESFGAHGIAACRLQLEATLAQRKDHLASYGRIDIGLDTYPYNGVTTTVEALWMGVPVVSMVGDRFVSRQGIGLLAHAGLSEWVAGNPEEYVAKAIGFSMDLDRLARTRTGLRDRVRNSSLVDAPGFAKHLADALTGMWLSRRCVG